MVGLVSSTKETCRLLQVTESQADSILFLILLFIGLVKLELIFMFEEIWVVEYGR